jgi:hypothetical protein
LTSSQNCFDERRIFEIVRVLRDEVKRDFEIGFVTVRQGLKLGCGDSFFVAVASGVNLRDELGVAPNGLSSVDLNTSMPIRGSAPMTNAAELLSSKSQQNGGQKVTFPMAEFMWDTIHPGKTNQNQPYRKSMLQKGSWNLMTE